MESKFIEGAIVAIYTGRGEQRLRKGKITKVYKNGNFVIDGDKQQYRPHMDTATRTGSDRWNRASVYLWTDSHDDELAAAGRGYRWRSATEWLHNHQKTPDEKSIADAEQIVAHLKKKSVV